MKKQKPVHIGIIPDGNRRWAVAHGLSKADGYHYGLEPGLRLLQQAKVYGIQELTYYGFTVDNCKRPHDQFAAFQKACVEAVQFLTTEGAGGIKLNFLVNYGWKWDLSHILQDGLPYSSDISRIDMVVRWGGMRRLSGFLPIQSVYADFYVEDKLWPDYENADFRKAMAWYEKQDDTFGG